MASLCVLSRGLRAAQAAMTRMPDAPDAAVRFSLLYKGNRRRATRLARQGSQRQTAQNRNDYNLTDTVWQIGAGERIGPAVYGGVHLLEQPCQIRRIGDKIEKITG